MKIAAVAGNELAEVEQFYLRVGYGGGVSAADTTLAARLGDRMIGVVRLCHEEGVIVLRGMQIDPAHQGHGVGLALLAACTPYFQRQVAYCLPYEHLPPFYQQAGFQVAAAERLPPFLASRLASYRARGQRVLAMRRDAD